MIGKLNHVAIAVPSVSNAADQYKNILGAKVSKPLDLPDHGVKTVFVELDNTKIELLEPIGKNSPIENFLKKNLFCKSSQNCSVFSHSFWEVLWAEFLFEL